MISRISILSECACSTVSRISRNPIVGAPAVIWIKSGARAYLSVFEKSARFRGLLAPLLSKPAAFIDIVGPNEGQCARQCSMQPATLPWPAGAWTHLCDGRAGQGRPASSRGAEGRGTLGLSDQPAAMGRVGRRIGLRRVGLLLDQPSPSGSPRASRCS